MNQNQINTQFTRDVICPHCGHIYRDSWEYNGDDGTVQECIECSEKFILYIDFEVHYCTEKYEERD